MIREEIISRTEMGRTINVNDVQYNAINYFSMVVIKAVRLWGRALK